MDNVRTRMSSLYSVLDLSPSQKEYHKKRLTLEQRQFNDVAVFFAYIEEGNCFKVPRFYGLCEWGKPLYDDTTIGDEINVQFAATLNEAQQRACNSVLLRFSTVQQGGVLVLPCGFGKTVCGLYTISRMRVKTLILVHKTFLVDQWRERIAQFLPGCAVGRIQQDVVDVDKHVVIGMIQSFSRREYDESVMRTFGMCIVDESHHIAAPVFNKAMRQVSARYILALSATPDRRDGLTDLLYWTLGSLCYEEKRDETEKTLVSQVIYTQGHQKEIMIRGQVNSALMINNLTKDVVRNTLIVDLLKRLYAQNRSIIVLSDRLKQLSFIKGQLDIPDVGFYVGSTSVHDREHTSAHARIILSTYSMATEGLDIPRLDTVLLATPKSGGGNLVQAIGRVQRKCMNKQTPLVVDIVDPFSVFERMRWQRHNMYKKNGFSWVELE